MKVLPRNYLQALRRYETGIWDGDTFVLWCDQCWPRMSDAARELVAKYERIMPGLGKF